jgi:hypothetical protein
MPVLQAAHRRRELTAACVIDQISAVEDHPLRLPGELWVLWSADMRRGREPVK